MLFYTKMFLIVLQKKNDIVVIVLCPITLMLAEKKGLNRKERILFLERREDNSNLNSHEIQLIGNSMEAGHGILATTKFINETLHSRQVYLRF